MVHLTTIICQYAQPYGQSFDSYDSNSLTKTDQSSKRSGSGSIIVPIGTSKHHPIKYVDYIREGDKESGHKEPPTFRVEGGPIPLNLIFSPRYTHLKVADDNTFGDLKDQRYTFSEEEPIYMYHEFNTPVFEEQYQSYQPYYTDEQPQVQDTYKSDQDTYKSEQDWSLRLDNAKVYSD